MLAQNFKTAADLGISDKEHQALVSVLGMLERGELRTTRNFLDPNIPNGFNMAIIGKQTECGTVGCILGWCRHIGGKHLFSFNGFTVGTPGVLELFMFGDQRRHRPVTTDQAARATRSYLSTGEANWREALASK